MNNLPVKYMPQAQQQGPYLKVTCAVRSDFSWVIPLLPGKQNYNCPVCFGCTHLEINEELKFWTWGEATYGTEKVDKLRYAMMQRQIPMMPFPSQNNGLEDLLNSLQ